MAAEIRIGPKWIVSPVSKAPSSRLLRTPLLRIRHLFEKYRGLRAKKKKTKIRVIQIYIPVEILSSGRICSDPGGLAVLQKSFGTAPKWQLRVLSPRSRLFPIYLEIVVLCAPIVVLGEENIHTGPWSGEWAGCGTTGSFFISQKCTNRQRRMCRRIVLVNNRETNLKVQPFSSVHFPVNCATIPNWDALLDF